MKKLHKNRLLKLAKHLEQGKLGHKIFNMRVWNAGTFDKNGCGTAGCAIGECPIVFPRLWIFRRNKILQPQPIFRDYTTVFSSIRAFFGLTCREAYFLFVPDTLYTARNQAKRIRKFVKKKK
jgi:hypothetical protein